MASARQILVGKGSKVHTVDEEASIVEAARLMNDHHVGALVVTKQGKLTGIFTERDVMRRVVAESLDPAATRVRNVMTTPVACGTPDTTYTELCAVMREKRIRHVPIVEADEVVGMISIGDLNRIENHEQEQTIKYLEQFISVA